MTSQQSPFPADYGRSPLHSATHPILDNPIYASRTSQDLAQENSGPSYSEGPSLNLSTHQFAAVDVDPLMAALFIHPGLVKSMTLQGSIYCIAAMALDHCLECERQKLDILIRLNYHWSQIQALLRPDRPLYWVAAILWTPVAKCIKIEISLHLISTQQHRRI